MLDYNHVVVWNDFKVLGKESNHWFLEIKDRTIYYYRIMGLRIVLLSLLFIKTDILLLNKKKFFFSFTNSVIKI